MNISLEKGELIENRYTVRFFIGGDDLCEKYRVIGNDGRTYLLKIYNSAQISRGSFENGKLLQVGMLSSVELEGTLRLVESGDFSKGVTQYNYLVFDFVSGESLQEKFNREGVLMEHHVVSIALRLLNILKGLHSSATPIIHNNINLSSITLDYTSSSRDAILGGFDLARYINSPRDSLDVEKLDFSYSAPELLNGVFTPKSDLFSVGAVMYKLLFGLPPWHIESQKFGYTPKKHIDALDKARKKALHFGHPGVTSTISEQIKNVIAKALSINPAERFPDCEEFIESLKGKVVLNEKQNTISGKPHVVPEGEGFSAIAGMQDLKNLLYEEVIRAFSERELFEKYGVTIPNGMLLYGPPGCGKTFIAEKLAEEVGFNFLQLKPSDMKSKYINESEEKISAIFKSAEEKAPSIVFIDEFDAIAPSREGDLHAMYSNVVNELLTHMSSCAEKGVFLIVATNRPDMIDPAIMRTGRLDKIIYVPPPDDKARQELFDIYLKDRPVGFNLDVKKLSELANGYMASDIKYIIDQSSREALKVRSKITQDLLESTLLEERPSVSERELLRYENLRNTIERKDERENSSEGEDFWRKLEDRLGDTFN